jgi:hypothetical protein
MTPAVLVACGSYSPPTVLHTRIFETARDFFFESKDSLEIDLIGGFISPVHAAYGKKGLAVIHVYKFTCAYAHTFVYVYTYMCVCIHMVCMYVYTYIYNICMYVCMYIRMYVCMYVYIRMYIHVTS